MAKPADPSVSYRCRACKATEQIPEEVVRHFDLMDCGDPSFPPRFRCERCGGEMWPKKPWAKLVKELDLGI
jgi:uncharacterized Zn finger protein